MPISIVDHREPNQVLMIVSGEMSMHDVWNVLIASRVGEQRHCAFLFDVSAGTISCSHDEIRQLAAYAAGEAQKSPMGPVAFISTDPGTFGLSRMYQSYSAAEGRQEVGVFRSLSDAQTWLAGLTS